MDRGISWRLMRDGSDGQETCDPRKLWLPEHPRQAQGRGNGHRETVRFSWYYDDVDSKAIFHLHLAYLHISNTTSCLPLIYDISKMLQWGPESKQIS